MSLDKRESGESESPTAARGGLSEDCRCAIREAVLGDGGFLRATFSAGRGRPAPWVRVVARPVEVRGERRLQFSYWNGRKDIRRNLGPREAPGELEALLGLPFTHITVQTSTRDLNVRVTRRGRALLSRGKPSRPGAEPDLAHDREKRHLLPADRPDPFLEAIGIMGPSGRVRAVMRGKFRQVNQFLALLEPVLPSSREGEELQIVDCGCGNAYLTCAVYHYLNHVRGVAARVVGVDREPQVIANCQRLREQLGWEGLDFRLTAILDYQPPASPDIVLSLHACDTATDEAIAQGVRWGSRVILAAPCCQHELRAQLRAPQLRPLLRHAVLRERQADLVTDAVRALALQVMGYRTEVVEFTSPEHTTKNLLIRAMRGPAAGSARFAREYQELTAFWGIDPTLERLLGEPFRRLVRGDGDRA